MSDNHILYCVDCGVIESGISDKVAKMLNGEDIRCRNCMIKRFGQAYVDNAENGAEEVDSEDLLDDDVEFL